MRIFLSYSSKDSRVAEEISLALIGAGYREVFFDKKKLAASGNYHEGIRDAVRQSDLLIFLITPYSVKEGCYALTELQYAEQKWPHPKGHVISVLLETVPRDKIPPYLRAVSFCEPKGNVAAEVLDAVRRGPMAVPVDLQETRPEVGAFQKELSALRHAVAIGSRFVVLGCALAVASGVIALLLFPSGSESYKTWGRSTMFLVTFSVLGLTLASSACGWAGWAFLSHAGKMMRRFEFEMNVSGSSIRSTLSGSSLISASTGLVQGLCWVTLFALGWPASLVTGIVTASLGGSLAVATSSLIHLISGSVFFLPYLMVPAGFRMRYFNPDKWSTMPWFIRRYIRMSEDQFAEITTSIKAGIEGLGLDVVSRQLRQLLDTWAAQFPDFLIAAFHACLRKEGLRLFFRLSEIEDLIRPQFVVAARESLIASLDHELPALSPEIRASVLKKLLG